jgi:hypothetical protein
LHATDISGAAVETTPTGDSMGEGWRIELATVGVWAVGRFRAWVLTVALCAGCAFA